MNVDDNEINKFNKLSSTWWDEDGPMWPLHKINPLRLSFILKNCEIKNKKVLDIGCGGGILTESLAKNDAIATGLDLAQDSIKIAQQHAAKNNLNIDYICENLEKFAENNQQSFDVITCMEMLEHVPDPTKIINLCQQILKPGGSLFVSTINRNPKAFLFAVVGAEYILSLLPRGTHEYGKFIKPSELNKWLRDNKLKTRETLGLHYNPFNKTFFTSDDISVNYMLYAKN